MSALALGQSQDQNLGLRLPAHSLCATGIQPPGAMPVRTAWLPLGLPGAVSYPDGSQRGPTGLQGQGMYVLIYGSPGWAGSCCGEFLGAKELTAPSPRSPCHTKKV